MLLNTNESRRMSVDTELADFKAGSNFLIYASIVFLLIAIFIPLYLYPGYFFAGFLNFLPFIIIIFFIFAYNITEFRKRASIILYNNMLIISMKNKKVKVYFSEISSITKSTDYGRKLYIIKTKGNRQVALYDRKILFLRSNLIDFIKEKMTENQ
jgi:hypothetical protein